MEFFIIKGREVTREGWRKLMKNEKEKNEVYQLIASAQVNLENLALGNPQVKAHPMFRIVEAQITEAMKILEGKG